MIGMIGAVSSNGVLGLNNKIPWHYPDDLKHFKETTLNSIVIMGRKTFESMGKPLSNRTNVVISSGANSTEYSGVYFFNSLKEAITKFSDNNKDIWLIGGASIYEEGMNFADKILLTITPDIINDSSAIKFPWINPRKFELTSIKSLNPQSATQLYLSVYKKIIM